MLWREKGQRLPGPTSLSLARGAAWCSGILGIRGFSDGPWNDSGVGASHTTWCGSGEAEGVWKASVRGSGVAASRAAASCSTRGARYQHRSETRLTRVDA